eukprot:TCONS_00045429-protein
MADKTKTKQNKQKAKNDDVNDVDNVNVNVNIDTVNIDEETEEGKKEIAEAITQPNPADKEQRENVCGKCRVDKETNKRNKKFIEWIQCDLCETWVCGECHQIEKKYEGCINIKEVHWVCTDCEGLLFWCKMEGGSQEKNRKSETNWNSRDSEDKTRSKNDKNQEIEELIENL